MPRVSQIGLDEAQGETARLYEATTQMLGRVPHSFRVLGQTPLVARMLLLFNATMQREGAGSVLSCKLKEMVIIKTSQVNACNY
ncbi:MAG: hypothetical protein HOC91_13120 [Nitrospinaceae bacterium]|jgi:hypothetical protein|nr:hypothetical protein [Nitrospinaceae bacterium]MBT3433427.1 hypothetical protein [Nitrospinaceae bacterium]MBT3821626.1 hypothetical protein [Nitrospinaceae bacterium]MBT4092548.1 hypothetical protein [Nitrospinaceae bacterium]MBT4431447.1 hypothetical protein [Nitrospinaceae bacterium]